ncbi:PKD domain-containing protein [Flavobacterium kingsejongi]|uniref:PKD domain-containing protein n=1 Tax=Flavobacterium kingsejongi TaxID=1678728 RepID=A0A2S1LK26_9FLAO|nr:PKD domain-containing protein [Flavobacterium kingsejongi]AWG24105.1 hypothetical protein FK004_02145 [Flavobacterium kingsejongi]
MNKTNQIKTHFDLKIIVFFIVIFIVSCGLLAFKINEKAVCTVKEFKVDAPSFRTGELITFSDDSKNSYEWRWYFGDGTKISYRSKVAHAFSKPGKYTVKLLVNNNCTVEQTITITAKNDVLDAALFPKFKSPKIVYQGDIVKFSDSTAHAKSWEWRFGDSQKIDALEKNPSYVYKTPGEKKVSLVVNGDIKYVKYASIVVLPAKKEQKDLVKERLERRGSARGDAVKEYFDKLPDAPKRSPEIANIDEEKFKKMLLGVSADQLSYENLTRYFCEDNLPLVQLKGGKSMSLKALDESVRNRGINVKKVTLQRDKDNCVTVILLNYKYKTIF